MKAFDLLFSSFAFINNKATNKMDEAKPTSLQDVFEAISKVEHAGMSSGSGLAPSLPSAPGLHVTGVGEIPLPLTEVYANLLKNEAEQAPHGQGSKTVLDLSIRNTLQIDPTKVSIMNPSWESGLESLKKQAVETLNLSIDPKLVRIELYKLLIYESGGFFKKHRETEKSDGMFATLVVQLPSRFEGASYVVSHNEESRTFKLDQDAAYGCKYVVHYADCEHEIKPVESGHRLALIYSLCFTGNKQEAPVAKDVDQHDLTRVLKHLPGKQSLFCVPLKHQYTSSSFKRFGAGALKGNDRIVQEAIRTTGLEDFQMVIARLQRVDTMYGEGEDEDDELYEIHRCETGEGYLKDMYFQDGSDASCHRKWMKRKIILSSLEEGGMVLVDTEKKIDDMWGEGDMGYVYEEHAQDVIYNTYVLIVFSKSLEGIVSKQNRKQG